MVKKKSTMLLKRFLNKLNNTVRPFTNDLVRCFTVGHPALFLLRQNYIQGARTKPNISRTVELQNNFYCTKSQKEKEEFSVHTSKCFFTAFKVT